MGPIDMTPIVRGPVVVGRVILGPLVGDLLLGTSSRETTRQGTSFQRAIPCSVKVQIPARTKKSQILIPIKLQNGSDDDKKVSEHDVGFFLRCTTPKKNSDSKRF